MLNRSRTLQALQSACDSRYRGLLETTLEHLDAAVAELDAEVARSEGDSAARIPED